MTAAMDLQSELGGSSSEIYSSLETYNACGIGMCGMCECGGTLTCQEGTFFNLSFLREHRIDIAVLCH
jgi:hypothetical protein